MRGGVTDAGRTTEQTLKIELLSQWKLEAEFRNIQLDDERSKPNLQGFGFTRIYAFCRENISIANYAFLG